MELESNRRQPSESLDLFSGCTARNTRALEWASRSVKESSNDRAVEFGRRAAQAMAPFSHSPSRLFRSLSGDRLHRQGKEERGSLPEGRLEPNPSAVPLYDLSAQRQPDSVARNVFGVESL